VYLLVFHAYVNEMHGSRSKIPSKKIWSDSAARRDLIPVLKSYYGVFAWSLFCVTSFDIVCTALSFLNKAVLKILL
jgi:hypothetical protein